MDRAKGCPCHPSVSFKAWESPNSRRQRPVELRAHISLNFIRSFTPSAAPRVPRGTVAPSDASQPPAAGSGCCHGTGATLRSKTWLASGNGGGSSLSEPSVTQVTHSQRKDVRRLRFPPSHLSPSFPSRANPPAGIFPPSLEIHSQPANESL